MPHPITTGDPTVTFLNWISDWNESFMLVFDFFCKNSEHHFSYFNQIQNLDYMPFLLKKQIYFLVWTVLNISYCFQNPEKDEALSIK